MVYLGLPPHLHLFLYFAEGLSTPVAQPRPGRAFSVELVYRCSFRMANPEPLSLQALVASGVSKNGRLFTVKGLGHRRPSLPSSEGRQRTKKFTSSGIVGEHHPAGVICHLKPSLQSFKLCPSNPPLWTDLCAPIECVNYVGKRGKRKFLIQMHQKHKDPMRVSNGDRCAIEKAANKVRSVPCSKPASFRTAGPLTRGNSAGRSPDLNYVTNCTADLCVLCHSSV